MAIFVAKAQASYRDFDKNSATDPSLVVPAAWNDPGDYKASYFESFYNFLLRSTFIADRFASPDTIVTSEVDNITPEDPDGTPVKAGLQSSYMGTIVLGGAVFVVLNGGSNGAILYGTPTSASFKFPDTLDLSTVNQSDYAQFTPNRDNWTGSASGDNADCLAGNDVAKGGLGADNIFGREGNDTLSGQGQNDRLYGGPGRDFVKGGAGRDSLFGDAGADNLLGGNGKDLLRGGGGTDLLLGGVEDDRLYGDAGNDRILGGDGEDLIFGGGGDDTLIGGGFADVISGDDGADTFLFRQNDSGKRAGERDTITDFDRAEGDHIDLARIDGDWATPGLQDLTFIGRSAFSDVGQVRFNKPAGLLDINTDGNTAPEIRIALTGVTNLEASDLFL